MARNTLLNNDPISLVREYKRAIEAAGIAVEQMIIFGSYAKGTARYDSDLDIGVVSPSFGKNSFAEMVQLAQIAAKIEPLIEPHPLNPEMLEDRWDPLAQQIKRYGKVIRDV